MPGRIRRIVTRLRSGDWPAKVITLSQVIAGFVAALGLVSMVTGNPVLILSFTFAQALVPVGIALFIVVAVAAQRTMIVKEFEPGDVIFAEGDVGREVYVVKSGNVEVLKKGADGTEELIAALGPGEYFGEMALLGKAPRNATVRAATPLEVLAMNPNNFFGLYTALPALKDHFHKVMQARLEELKVHKVTGRKH
jgi:hypothetical protein